MPTQGRALVTRDQDFETVPELNVACYEEQ
jgi:predicted nucleic acid-binding protein